MKLSIVIPALNGFKLTAACYKTITDNLFDKNTEIVIIDNGSSTPLSLENVTANTRIVRNEKSTGVYPTFRQGIQLTTGDVVVFFHNDVAVWERDWDKRVLERFERNDKLGLAGFIGSWDIEEHGGRGLGTASNFMGKTLEFDGSSWHGSAAEVHGRRLKGEEKALHVDGCVMIFRREAFYRISDRPNFPPHHFYDRLLSCQIIEAGYEGETIGVEFDHFSGQTVNSDRAWLFGIAKEWCIKNLGTRDTEENIYDYEIYREAERQFIKEFRDEKHFIPRRINPK